MSHDHDDKREISSNKCSKMRMDSKVSNRIRSHGKDSLKRKELNTVMRKARESQSTYWNKKLLEVEARDPNRWRHSGYKEMYVGECSIEDYKSYLDNPKHRSSRSRSPKMHSYKNLRSPNMRNSCIRQPRALQSKLLRQKIRSSQSPRLQSPATSRSRTPGLCNQKNRKSRSSSHSSSSRIHKEHNNLTKRVNKSPTSESTCSDKSCSVCSPKDCRPILNTSNSKSKSSSPDKTSIISKEALSNKCTSIKQNRINSSSMHRMQNLQTDQPLQCCPKEYEKTTKGSRVKKKERIATLSHDPRISQSVLTMRKRVKVEGAHANMSAAQPIAETSASDDSDSSSTTSHHPPPRMTLSERFGKMAQWSVDRRDMENMRITKVGNSTMKVVVEGEERIARLGYDSPPPGHYPDALLIQGPRGLDSWDDVHVRYDYYKSRGYLRDLTLDDYIKWEEWWYKYQEWLEAERYYEQWAAQSGTRSSSGCGRKRRRRNNMAH